MKKFWISFCFLFSVAISKGQVNSTVLAYIDQYRDLAIAEMQRTGIPAAIKLAQGIHESGAGKSDLANRSNNHFGIKCKSNWTGEKVYHDDDERGECFRKYSSSEESYKDHSNFLKANQRYSSLFKLHPEDYKGWANGLKKAGYATNPKYPTALIKIIEDYNLQDYTLMALGKKEWIPTKTNPQEEVAFVAPKKEEPIAFVQEKPVTKVESIKQEVIPVVQKEVIPLARNFPEGVVFRLNDLKVIFAPKGTPYFAIAQQHKVPLKKLFDYNDLSQAEETQTDELVFLQSKKKKGNAIFHTVAEGETLRDIAQFQGIRLESLLEYNYLKPGEQPAVGEKLQLQTKATAKPRLYSPSNQVVAAK